jgi:hypothetical protein
VSGARALRELSATNSYFAFIAATRAMKRKTLSLIDPGLASLLLWNFQRVSTPSGVSYDGVPSTVDTATIGVSMLFVGVFVVWPISVELAQAIAAESPAPAASASSAGISRMIGGSVLSRRKRTRRS